MAQGDWTFWTHGASVQVENLQAVAYIQRAGFGTAVEQEAKTAGWFHFAIPTPTQLDGVESVKHESVFIKFSVNDNAKISKVDVWCGNRMVVSRPTDLHGADNYFQVELPHHQARDAQGQWAGLCVCMWVEFLTGTPRGHIVFQGAGATFERS